MKKYIIIVLLVAVFLLLWVTKNANVGVIASPAAPQSTAQAL